jgi:preprotein translocase subunit SecA
MSVIRQALSSMRNSLTFRRRLSRWQGSTIDFDLRGYAGVLAAINDLEAYAREMTDAQLATAARQARARAGEEKAGSSALAEGIALIREGARRTLGMRAYDVQVVAALALAAGHVVDMQTGEGKTLAAALTAAWSALPGSGVHVLTSNDYLARRDAEWMRPAYALFGLSVEFVDGRMMPVARRRGYGADVTYVTAKEAGFDYLRDQLALAPADVVHRPFHMAIADEADSLLIDEGRLPLVIAGHVEQRESHAERMAALVANFDPGVHFSLDEYARDVELTDAGIELIENELACGTLHDPENITVLTELQCALHAHALLRRDVDYLVRNGRVELVDELTGRVVYDRHWPDGLQAAIEAKEHIQRSTDGRVLGSITMQHFLRQYPTLCGMSGTAQDAAAELFETYGLSVTVVPTNVPVRRFDHPDVVFSDRASKEQALLAEITSAHAIGRPVVVGTISVEESERLASKLTAAGIPCAVLNARNDEQEADIVAQAGRLGAVTISTNMAGRGTDIKLGGADESQRHEVLAAGGLYVLGTNRHESRRVDLQLRGRAGRQGDPGDTRFFVALDDDLLVRYRLGDLLAGRVQITQQGPIDHRIVHAEIARVQRIVDGQHFEIRRTLRRYAAVLEQQRSYLMARRAAALFGEDATTLLAIDRAWRDHLSLSADLREGIHLVTLGGRDPLGYYTAEMIAAFTGLVQRVDADVLDSSRLGPSAAGLKGPSSTWTYVVNDDPFRNHITRLLTGPGNVTLAVYAAGVLTPLLLLWGLVERLRRRGHRLG